ncbi:MAG: dihydropteroate synthase [Planctomycetes bacterium]|nr:dihydropteroate synthase [Planctomycetota bacterium]
MKTERLGFVTGRLAEFALRGVLERTARESRLDYQVLVQEISVAALMTPAWVARRLKAPPGLDRLILPGYCDGDLEPVRRAAGVPVERGPKDLRALPRWLRAGGQGLAGEGPPEGYGRHRLEIIAEINHAPRLPFEEILAMARSYREQGADVIDLGCDPDGPWEGVGETIRRLRAEGFRMAVDTFDPREIVLAVKGGAELVLSVNGKNLAVAKDLGCEVVAIPDNPHTLQGLEETVARLEAWKAPYRLDPVLEPIGFGFAESLGRYLETRRRWPGRPLLMGIGNLTELTDVDSAGVNALLIGFCEELGIGSVLTTAVIPWARSAVQEIDLARRLMHYAVSNRVLPKHLERGLLLLRDAEVLDHGQEVLDQLAAKLQDPNYRIFAERGELHVMNRDRYLRGRDPFELFEEMVVGDPSHAFYLGYELAKALLALQLGKQYVQDQALRWGFLTREEESHLERQKKRKEREKHRP